MLRGVRGDAGGVSRLAWLLKAFVNCLGLGCRRPETLDTMPLPIFLSQQPEGGQVGGDPSPPTAVKLVCSRMGPHSGEWGDAGGV